MNALLPAALSLFALTVAPGATKTAAPTKSKTLSKATKTKGKPVAKAAKVTTFAPKPGTIAPVAQSKAVDRLLTAVPPPKMSKATLSKATDLEIKELNWAFLTPTATKRSGRAHVSFYKPEMISSASNRAVFTRRCHGVAKAGDPPCHEGAAGLRISAREAGLYVVNCSLQTAKDDVGDWLIQTSGGEARITATPGWNQVAFVIHAGTPGKYSARIRGLSRAWALASCSINTVG